MSDIVIMGMILLWYALSHGTFTQNGSSLALTTKEWAKASNGIFYGILSAFRQSPSLI